MLDLLPTGGNCRKFEDKAVEMEKKEKPPQAAQLRPTGKNTRPWEFVVVKKKETFQKLGDCRQPNQSFSPKIPLATVVSGNTQKTDTWIEDASIAVVIMQLGAEKLELSSCWAQIRLRESNRGMSSEGYVHKLPGTPEHMAVLSITAMGYPSGIMPTHQLDEVDQAKIHTKIY